MSPASAGTAHILQQNDGSSSLPPPVGELTENPTLQARRGLGCAAVQEERLDLIPNASVVLSNQHKSHRKSQTLAEGEWSDG